jgi:tetratricopeptide (TPR) repeat protein
LVTLHDILERARASGQKLSPGEALWLFAAVTREAAEKKATIRSRLVQIDANGVLQLARFDEKRPEDEPGYLAPELLEKGGPRKDEPRVQVYAAGALGYEIFTGHAPDPRKAPGAELTGPAADVVRIAMAHDRRERFGDLNQLREAVDALQQPADPEDERHAFAALVARGEKAEKSDKSGGALPELGRQALTKLIDHVGQLGRQMEAVRNGLADVQRDQRDLLQRVAVLESRGGSGSPAPKGRSSPVMAVLAGMLGAAVAVAAVGVVAVKVPRLGAGRLLRAAIGAPSTSSSAPSPTAVAVTPANGAAPAAASAVSAPQPPPSNAALSATAAPAVAFSAPPAASAATPTPPSPTPVASAANATSDKAAPPKPSQAEMARAVAEAQVRRGDQELERGRYDAAAEEFQLALANDPTIAVAWRGLGIAHLMRHNEESARKAYAKYLQLAPNAPDARDIRKAIAELNARAKIGKNDD